MLRTIMMIVSPNSRSSVLTVCLVLEAMQDTLFQRFVEFTNGQFANPVMLTDPSAE
jgi:hypothetical protein